MIGYKIFDSVADWKADALYLYSDAHKDAYGFRSHGSEAWMFDANVSMETVMGEVDDLYTTVNREIKRENHERIVWETAKWIHSSMVLEAKCEDNGVVFPNADWCDMCEDHKNDLYGGYSDYARVLGPEDFYFDRGGNTSTLGDLL